MTDDASHAQRRAFGGLGDALGLSADRLAASLAVQVRERPLVAVPGTDGLSRRSNWPNGLCWTSDDGGCYVFDGPIDAETFRRSAAELGEHEGAALMFDMIDGGNLTLTPELAWIVVRSWCSALYGQHDTGRDWLAAFRQVGFSRDGEPAEPPTEPVEVHRACPPDGRFGMAWTTDPAVAERFRINTLIRERAVAYVYTATVAPEHLLAYLGAPYRREAEYVWTRPG